MHTLAHMRVLSVLSTEAFCVPFDFVNFSFLPFVAMPLQIVVLTSFQQFKYRLLLRPEALTESQNKVTEVVFGAIKEQLKLKNPRMHFFLFPLFPDKP